ncbi:hypothetical protein KR059_002888 [Drosophila kikkawai]|nr:hypothetical protein KR059_002888 [Drosophila kikkawai]
MREPAAVGTLEEELSSLECQPSTSAAAAAAYATAYATTTQRLVRRSFSQLGSVNTEDLSLAISRYDEIVMALMLRYGELEAQLAMPPPSLPDARTRWTAGIEGNPRGITCSRVCSRMFTDRRGKAAILLDHQDAICMPVETLTTDHGVCLVVKGRFGSIFLCSAYCQFVAPLKPYLRYMDAVLLQASRTPAILGLDANAVSPTWVSKLPRHTEGQANYDRGEWMLEARAAALNQPTELVVTST